MYLNSKKNKLIKQIRELLFCFGFKSLPFHLKKVSFIHLIRKVKFYIV